MYSIRLEGETTALLRKMRRYSEIDRRSLNMALGEGVRESTLERFKEGRAPDGRRWKTSIRAATTGGKTLIDSSQLRNSIQVTADASGFAVGTNAKHAATHQFGDQGRTIRARKAKNLRFQVGGQWVSKKQVKVNIPARRFSAYRTRTCRRSRRRPRSSSGGTTKCSTNKARNTSSKSSRRRA